MTTITIEERSGKWLVIVDGPNGRAVVGRHTAKFRAREQRDRLAAEGER